MNIHLMYDEKFIDTFISKYTETHHGIISKYYVMKISKSDELLFVKNSEVIPVKFDKKTWIKILEENVNIENIFLHNFSKNLYSLIDYIPQKIKIFWIFHGTEIFQNPLTFKMLDEESESLYPRIYQTKKIIKYLPLTAIRALLVQREKLRVVKIRKILSRIDYFCHWNELDFVYLQGEFPEFKAKLILFGYGSTLINKSPALTTIKKGADKSSGLTNKCIMIGNSSTVTLNHLTILNYIKHFNNDNFIILCPLSYGDKEYRQFLINYARINFPYNFESLVEFIPFDEYQQKISNVDVLVMNNIRTQGGGNISLALLEGKKVYMNPKNTHYQKLKNIGINIFSIDNLLNSTFEEIFTPLSSDQRVKNIELTTIFLNEIANGYYHLP